MAVPSLVIQHRTSGKELVFALTEGFSDSYTNDFKELDKTAYRTHTIKQLWQGGRIQDLSITIDVAAGCSHKVQTPDDVVKVVEDLYSMTVGNAAARSKQPSHVHLMVRAEGAPWFVRRGFIKNISVEFMPPWDAITGKPFRAKIKLTLTADYTYPGQKIDSRRLPHPPWRFDKLWG